MLVESEALFVAELAAEAVIVMDAVRLTVRDSEAGGVQINTRTWVAPQAFTATLDAHWSSR